MVAGDLLASIQTFLEPGRGQATRVISVPVSRARVEIHSLVREVEDHMFFVLVTWRGEPIAGLMRPQAALRMVVRELPHPDRPRFVAALQRGNLHPKAHWPPDGPRKT